MLQAELSVVVQRRVSYAPPSPGAMALPLGAARPTEPASHFARRESMPGQRDGSA